MILKINVLKRLLPIIFVISHSLIWSQQILFTEIMYDLEGSDSPNEYVELFNPSDSDSIDLKNWTIRDRSSEDALIDSGFGLKIPPLSYGLILEGDYNLDTGIYQANIPANTILIKVDDSSIGNGLSTTDSLFLLDSNGITIDSLGWEDWAQDGFSLERIRYHLPNNPSNWVQSVDSLGTPGTSNSVLPDSIDISIGTLTLSDSVITQSETTTLFGEIVNVGLNTTSPEIQIFIDGVYATNEFLGAINELDTTIFEIELGPLASGSHWISVNIIADGETNFMNNSDSISVGVHYPFRTIVLNEFLSYPNSGLKEFVEIVNISNDTLNLEHWKLSDNNATLYSFPNEIILPNQFGVISSDSSYIDNIPEGIPYLVPVNGFPSLNNGGDAIQLYDPFGTIIDTLVYDNTWDLSQGISQEKVYVDDESQVGANWFPSVSSWGHTIGTQNSVTPSTINGTIISSGISYSPSVPTQTDNVILTIPVRNSGTANFSGTIFVSSLEGVLGQETMNSGELDDTTWVEISIGMFSSGKHSISIELNIPGDESTHDNSAVDTILVRFPFGTVLINEFLSSPNNDQSEFIELIAFDDLDMTGWGFSDNHKNPVFLDSLNVLSNEFIVIIPDSNLLSVIENSVHIQLQPSFPSLNNSADGIFIFDQTGSIIDSLNYDAGWPITSERSTEKKRPDYVSNIIENWDIAELNTGITPGYQNSRMVLDVDGAIITNNISYSPNPPFPDSTVTLTIPVANVGVENFSGTLSVELDEEEIGNAIVPMISVGDTALISTNIMAPSSGRHDIIVILDQSNDGNTDNNIGTFSLAVRFPFGSVLFNELFPLPDSTQSEFIELIPQISIQIDGWSLLDASGAIGEFSSQYLPPFSYIVLTEDSSLSIPDSSHLILPNEGLPSLNNSSESLYIRDHTESIIDSIHYDEGWSIQASRSIEKYRLNDISDHPNHWGVSVGEEGQTPGLKNSLFFDKLPQSGTINLSPNPFSPDGDGFDDELKLTYSLPFESAAMRWEIFDVNGRKIATPFYNYYVGQNGELKWNGNRDNGTPARIGIYIMKISFQDQMSIQSWETIKAIVLAKRL